MLGAVLALALVGVLVLLAGGFMSHQQAPVGQPLRVKDYTKALQDCMENANRTVQPIRSDFPIFKEVWVTCANQIYFIDLMEDFDIRREKLIRQELDERVILWMVVAITMSGVFLAGMQLLGSYKLAASGTAKFGEVSNISVEAGKEASKLSVQSSVTGLMILVVSLAFFIVYVKWIYSIQEVGIEKPQSLNEAPATGTISGYGTLGPASGPAGTIVAPSGGGSVPPVIVSPQASPPPAAKPDKGAAGK